MEGWELEAREAIRDLVARYAQGVDSGRFDDVVELFVADAVLEVDGEAPRHGRDAIRDFFRSVGAALAAASTVPHIRHHTSNLVIETDAPGRARASCYFLAVTERGVDHWGRYRDELVLDDGRWRFAHRRVRTDGAVPGGFAAERRPGARSS